MAKPGLETIEVPEATDPEGAIQATVDKTGKASVAGKIALDPTQTEAILTNMQKYIDEREGFMPSLARGLTRGMATARGPAALATIDQQQNLQDKQIMDYRTQMAAYRAAQSQAIGDESRFKSTMSPSTGTGASDTSQVSSTILNDPDIRRRLSLAKTYAEKNAIIDEASKKEFENSSKARYDAASNTPQEYMLPPFGPIKMTPNQWRTMPAETKAKMEKAFIAQFGEVPAALTGATPSAATPSAATPSAATPSAATPTSNAVSIAQSLGVPIISGNRDWDKQNELYIASKQPGYSGPPVAPPGKSQHQFGNAIDVGRNLPEDQKAKLRQAGFSQPYANDPGHWELRGAPAQTAVNKLELPTAPDNFPVTQGEWNQPKPAMTAPAATPAKVSAPAAIAAPAPSAVSAPAPSAVSAPAPSAVSAPVAKPAPTSVITEPAPDPAKFGSNQKAYDAALEAWKTRQSEVAKGQGTEAMETAKAETAKKNEMLNDVTGAQSTVSELDKLLTASKGNQKVFNPAGQGVMGPLTAWALHKQKATVGESDETEHDTVARHIMNNEDYTKYKNIKQGAAEAQAAWAKNLISGAGGRLTNADLNLGKIAKGVGVETTYEAHMFNLAKQMEKAQTAYYRGVAFKDWLQTHPDGKADDFALTDAYKIDSKIKAAKDIAAKFADVPEVIGKGGDKYIQKDKNGEPYVLVNGKGYYLK